MFEDLDVRDILGVGALLFLLGRYVFWYFRFIQQGGLKRIDDKAWMKWFAAFVAVGFLHVAFPKTETAYAWIRVLEMETAPPLAFDVDAAELRAMRGPVAVLTPVQRPDDGVKEFGKYGSIAKSQPVVEVWSLMGYLLLPGSTSPRNGYYSLFGHKGDPVMGQQRLTCRLVFDGSTPQEAKRVCDILLPVNRKFAFLDGPCDSPLPCYQDFYYGQLQLRAHPDGIEILPATIHGKPPEGELTFRQSFAGKSLPSRIGWEELQSALKDNAKVEFSAIESARRAAPLDERDRVFGIRVDDSADTNPFQTGAFFFGHANLFLHLAQDFVTGDPRPLTDGQRKDLYVLAAITASDYFSIAPNIPNCRFNFAKSQSPLFHYTSWFNNPDQKNKKGPYVRKSGRSKYWHLAPNLTSKDPLHGDVVTADQICDGTNASVIALAVWLEAYFPQPESLRQKWGFMARQNELIERERDYHQNEVNRIDGKSPNID